MPFLAVYPVFLISLWRGRYRGVLPSRETCSLSRSFSCLQWFVPIRISSISAEVTAGILSTSLYRPAGKESHGAPGRMLRALMLESQLSESSSDFTNDILNAYSLRKFLVGSISYRDILYPCQARGFLSWGVPRKHWASDAAPGWDEVLYYWTCLWPLLAVFPLSLHNWWSLQTLYPPASGSRLTMQRLDPVFYIGRSLKDRD